MMHKGAFYRIKTAKDLIIASRFFFKYYNDCVTDYLFEQPVPYNLQEIVNFVLLKKKRGVLKTCIQLAITDLPTLTVSGLISRSHGLASKSHGFVAPGSLTVRAITHDR